MNLYFEGDVTLDSGAVFFVQATARRVQCLNGYSEYENFAMGSLERVDAGSRHGLLSISSFEAVFPDEYDALLNKIVDFWASRS